MLGFLLSPAPLPSFLDPFLDYLSDALPPPIYSFVVRVLCHSMTLFTSTIKLFHTFTTLDPSEWNIQTILPPLISLIAAYFALLSIYRTTTWVMRIVFFFLKWGVILVALMTLASYIAGSTPIDSRVLNHVGAAVWGTLNAQDGEIPGTGSQSVPLRAWDSFKKHREWRSQQETDKGEGKQSEDVFQEVVDAAERFFQQNKLWNVAKQVVAGMGGDQPNDQLGRAQGERRIR